MSDWTGGHRIAIVIEPSCLHGEFACENPDTCTFTPGGDAFGCLLETTAGEPLDAYAGAPVVLHEGPILVRPVDADDIEDRPRVALVGYWWRYPEVTAP